MSDSVVVLVKTYVIFLVMLVGWFARRRAYLSAETATALGRFVVDITFPALVFTQMLKTVDVHTLKTEWYVPLLGAGLLIIAELAGFLARPFFVNRERAPTFVFLIATPNWIYLPLPIVEVLFGGDGVRAVLFCNVGTQVLLWTMGVWTLEGGKVDLRTLRSLALNPGLLATAAGILLALWCPSVRSLDNLPLARASGALLFPSGILQGLAMLGSLTVPLSLVVTGAQLSSLNLKSIHSPGRDLSGVILARLLVGPALTIAFVQAARMAGVHIPDVPRLVAYLIACMPVAISCSMFTEWFGGDVALSARSIFFTTLWSILTVPCLFALIRHLGW